MLRLLQNQEVENEFKDEENLDIYKGLFRYHMIPIKLLENSQLSYLYNISIRGSMICIISIPLQHHLPSSQLKNYIKIDV